MLELEKQAHRQACSGSKLQRVLQIARHYRWSQIARRGWNVAKARIGKSARIKAISTPDNLELRHLDRAKSLAEIIIAGQSSKTKSTTADLQQGRLTRLNQQADVGWPIDWSAANSLPHLWRFQLHYHEFLLPVAAHPTLSRPPQPGASQEQIGEYELARKPIWLVVDSWIDQHLPEQTFRSHESWHPYCISRRLPVWIWLLAKLPVNESLALKIMPSLYKQASHLHSNLEKDLGGNHLLENLTALATAATVIYSPDSPKWLETVSRLMETELQRQILPHGEHFELSPMYHCQILSNLLRIHWMCQDIAPKLAEMCRQYAKPMYEFLLATLHPDNEIALLGDSGFGEAPSVAEIKQLANLTLVSGPNANSLNSHPETGPYWVHRNGPQPRQDFVIFDRGETATPELPAHGHCDLLGFEASIQGRRWFVDSGNFNYESDSMRSYCRSSLAHNVVTLNGCNQSQIWSKFRMGDRAKMLSSDRGEGSGFSWATGACDAYRELGVAKIERLFAVFPSRSVWACVDFVSAADTMTTGTEIVAYLHLAPELTANAGSSGRIPGCFELSDGTTTRQIAFFNTTETRIEEGWYCPEFGIRKKNIVLIYHCSDSSQPFGWLLSNLNGAKLSPQTSQARFVVNDEDNSPVFDWNF